MRIAILTLPLHTNYGGILQAYALQTVLERMGHSVEVLQKNPHSLEWNWKIPLIYIKKYIKQIYAPGSKAQEKDIAYTRQNTDRFINKYIHRRLISSIYDIRPSDYDCIVVGSDQIWRRIYYAPQYRDVMYSIDPRDAFLRFTSGWDIKRIAYAASFGVDDWEYSSCETISCAELLQKFDSVSLREKNGVENCSNYLGYKAKHVLDPTMLLEKSDYLELINASETKSDTSSNNNMFCYILDRNNNTDRIINRISKNTGLSPIYMTGDVVDIQIQPPVEEWIEAINSSSIVVTDSFHACVFSIIFRKPFIAIGNKGRGLSRFNSLLDTFNLKNQLIDEGSSSYPSLDNCMPENIDFVLNHWRKESLRFLSNAIK